MAKNINEVKNNGTNEAIIKKETKQPVTEVTETKSENSEETSTEVATPEKEKLTTKVWRKVKKPLAIVGGVAAGAAALFVAAKCGEAKGFDKACDAFGVDGSDPEPSTDGEETNDISDEVSVTEVTDD